MPPTPSVRELDTCQAIKLPIFFGSECWSSVTEFCSHGVARNSWCWAATLRHGCFNAHLAATSILLGEILLEVSERLRADSSRLWSSIAGLNLGKSMSNNRMGREGTYRNREELRWASLRLDVVTINKQTPAGFKPNQPKPSVKKGPDVAVWRPKERWRKAYATAWHHLTGSGEIATKTQGSGPSWTNSFRLAWIELRGPEGRRSTCIRSRETPAGFKPNQPKPSVEKVPDVAFWRPKERWRKANATAGHHLAGSVEIVKMTSPDRQRRNC